MARPMTDITEDQVEIRRVLIAPSNRIDQMMRVMEVLHEKGLTTAEALEVLRAFYGEPSDE